MGLAIVELTMSIEEQFGIRFPDQDAANMHTVGDMYDYIVKKYHQANSTPCQTSRIFYRFRSALMAICGAPRNAVKLDAPLEQLIPLLGRRDSWQRIQKAMDLWLPDLCRPRWMERNITLVTAILSLTGIGLISILFAGHPFGGLGLVLLPSAFIFHKIATRNTLPLAINFPTNCLTVRDMVGAIVDINGVDTKTASDSDISLQLSDDQIWERLQSIICEEMKLTPEKVTRATRFYEDLQAC
ncbi:MAG: phosphopantetheine-binding protein [Armatimonadota bacterium]